MTERGCVTVKGVKCCLQFFKIAIPTDSDYMYLFLIYILGQRSYTFLCYNFSAHLLDHYQNYMM
jgi:hypothetical protein